MVLFSSFYGISTCLGDMELDSLGVLFLSLPIRRSIGRSWDRLGDLEFYRDLNREIVRATKNSNGRL